MTGNARGGRTPAPVADPLEAAVRGLLHDGADRLRAPVSVYDTLDQVVARGRLVSRRRVDVGRLRPLAAMAAVVATLVVVVATGLLVGRSGTGRPAVGEGDDDRGPAIHWDSGAVRLEAASLRIVARGTFAGQPDVVDGTPAIDVGSDPGDPTYRTLEVEWREHGVPMRLYIYFAADDTEWWVTELRTYDGSSGGQWVHYPAPLFRTPLGGTYAGDLEATGQGGGVPGSLRIEGLRLTAFAPGTGPAPLTGCRPWRVQAGGPLLRTEDLAGLPAAQVAARLRERGICFEFRWSYSTGPGTGYSERWCVPPPTGRVSDVHVLDDGVALVTVEDDSGIVREVRDQPPAGWGCPSDQRGAASTGSSAPADSRIPSATPGT